LFLLDEQVDQFARTGGGRLGQGLQQGHGHLSWSSALSSRLIDIWLCRRWALRADAVSTIMAVSPSIP
jgi:hypothetical protein